MTLGIGLLAYGGPGRAQHGNVEFTVHNLSVSGPGEIRSLTETRICKFCHIPHSAVVPVALWSQQLSTATYQVPSIATAKGARVPAPQPDGSSRLCLSCHDGTVALGEIAGAPRSMDMTGAGRLEPGRPGFVGTDLSGSHPVSFVVPDGDLFQGSDRDMGLRPLEEIRADSEVKLDGEGKMQCTACHDPHSDFYYHEGVVPRFWVKPTVEEVCLTCHELR
ncbi:MAG: cytochrome c3 family protein [Planctomycetota bacterium]|jgi:hypothetical protein